MKKQFVLFILLLTCNVCNAQKNDYNWVFDDSVGINFSNLSSPAVFYPALYGGLDENYSSISDADGNLMFYINGGADWSYSSVFNQFGQLMDNGDSIPSHRSITQGSLILPFMNDPNKYYLIYLSTVYSYSIPNGLYYSVIDMSLNSGAGKVISKNNLIFESNSLSEKLTAVKNGNGRDWWIFTHDENNADFIKVLLSPTGFSSPNYQSIGTSYNSFLGSQGQMLFSPEGKHLCSAGTGFPGILDYFDFNRCTGLLYNYTDLNLAANGSSGNYGCSFSPDGSKLYASRFSEYNSQLIQYNIDASSILASGTLLFTADSNYTLGQHLLAPDNKIYFVTASYSQVNNVNTANSMNLSVINYPDSIHSQCQLMPNSFYLGGRRATLSLPNMVNYRLGSDEGSGCDTLSMLNIEGLNMANQITIAPNPFNSQTTVTFSENQTHTIIRIIDLFGKELETIIFTGKQLVLDKAEMKAGIYFLQTTDNKKNSCNKKIIIE